MARKIYSKSRLGVKPKKSVVMTASERNVRDVLVEANRSWDAMRDFRDSQKRCRNYTFGDQWNDMIKDPNCGGKSISEKQHIIEQGKVPLVNNRIRLLINSVLGQFASTQTKPMVVASDRDEQKLGEMMSIAVQHASSINNLWKLDISTLERFLIGAVVCHKTSYGYNSVLDREDVIVKEINPSRLFFDTSMEDHRYWDMDLIGEIHDLTISDLIAAFCNGDRKKAIKVRDMYASISEEQIKASYENLTTRNIDDLSFFIPKDSSLCRVIEVWRKESKERYMCHDTLEGTYYKIETNQLQDIYRENANRISQSLAQGISEDEVPLIETEFIIDRYWYARWLTPYGDVIKEMETPYYHKQHPYTIEIYPFIDGKVQSFVADVIDQQRYINRLTIMLDFIMSASAKGVLLFPEDQLPDGYTLDDIADEWSRYNGVIMFKPKPGVPIPQQISTNNSNIGAYEMIQMQTNLMNEISGINSAIRGGEAKSGTAASLYAQQAQNSATNLIALLERFKAFRKNRDTRVMQTIQQFYNDKRYINLAGESYSEESKHFNPIKVRDVSFDLTIEQSTNTAAFREIVNQDLKELLQGELITLEDYLRNSSMPFADNLLQKIEERKKEMQEQQGQMQGQQGINPQDPQQMAAIAQMMQQQQPQ